VLSLGWHLQPSTNLAIVMAYARVLAQTSFGRDSTFSIGIATRRLASSGHMK
jgi:hypothetical protein